MTGGLRFVIPALHYQPDYPSGAARLAYDEAVYLAGRGHEVWVVTQDMVGGRPEHEFTDGVHVLRYPRPSLGPFNPRRLRVHQALTGQILARHVTGPVDVIHGHALLQYAGALDVLRQASRACYSVHSPLALEIEADARGAPALQRAKRWVTARLGARIERTCLLKSDAVMAYSDYTRMLIAGVYGRRIIDKTTVVPGWVDTDRFRVRPDRASGRRALGWPEGPPILFTLRRLVPRMGLDRLIDAAARLRTEGWGFRLVIGGDGPLRGSLEAMADARGVADVIEFAGRVEEAALPLMYATADAFVVPTAELEGFGLIVLEALASGCTVLATPVGAIPEIVRPIEPRWLAADPSAVAIASLLAEFLRGALPVHAPEALHAAMAERYSREDVLARWADAIMGPLRTPGAGRHADTRPASSES